jgi:hypothetical protein
VTVGSSSAAVMMGNTNVANVNVNNLRGDVTSKAGLSSPSVTATDGTVTTQSQLTQVNPFGLKGRSLSVSGSGCGVSSSGSKVTFSCPNIQMSNNFQQSDGSANLSLQGALTAIGDLSNAKTVSANDVPKAP